MKRLMLLASALLVVGCGGGVASGSTASDVWKQKACKNSNGISKYSEVVFDTGSQYTRTAYRYYGEGCVQSDLFFNRATTYSYVIDGEKIRTTVKGNVTTVTDGSMYVPGAYAVGHEATYDYIREGGYLYLNGIVYIKKGNK